ncbi:hypothetical protein B0H16DRAFT_1329757, partial [Mycena metata]
MKNRDTKFQAQLAAFKVLDASAQRTAHLASARIAELSKAVQTYAVERHKQAADATATITPLRKQIKSLKQRIRRSVRSVACTVARERKKWSTVCVTKKGVYTVEVRKLARLMAGNGCTPDKVGSLMEKIGDFFGIHITKQMSGRTVRRVILEGGVAAKMQATYELMNTPGVTISADSTSNRGINIESAHMALRVPDYASGSLAVNLEATPKVRFLGVDKTMDHTSAESVRGWSERVQEFCDIFNRSPLAKRLASQYGIRDFLRILKGMNGDHAANEKSTAKGIQELKHEGGIEDLGEEALAGKDYMELVNYLGAWNARKIAEAGGVDGWNALAPEEQLRRDKEMMKQLVTVLGKEAYDMLSPEDRRRIDLFLWGGCCMHKDLNSFKGGNTEMMLEWSRLGLPGPALLANKANTSVLRNVLDPAFPRDAVLTDEQFKVFEASTRGGVKACTLAGAIFNNKD